ncbi:MAG: hypothetical protein U0X92_01700 [Anaerolineales bacterium]
MKETGRHRSLRVTCKSGINHEQKQNLTFGALVGAFAGLIAALMLNRRAEKNEKRVRPHRR